MKHGHLEFRGSNKDILLHSGPCGGERKRETKIVNLGNWRTGSKLLQELFKEPGVGAEYEVCRRWLFVHEDISKINYLK